MTDITELTQEAARESGSILIIVAARMARREFFTPLHALCESGRRVVSTRALCDAVERAEERMVSQVPKIVDGHDRLTKKLKEAESRNAELVEALEKAQAKNALVAGGIEATAKLHERIAELESRTVTIKLSKDHVDDADLFGWGVIVVPLEALKEACADAGVSVEITAAGGKVEAE